jgi:hypothetical protein
LSTRAPGPNGFPSAVLLRPAFLMSGLLAGADAARQA